MPYTKILFDDWRRASFSLQNCIFIQISAYWFAFSMQFPSKNDQETMQTNVNGIVIDSNQAILFFNIADPRPKIPAPLKSSDYVLKTYCLSLSVALRAYDVNYVMNAVAGANTFMSYQLHSSAI